MLATNSSLSKEKGCSPVSSNCVIWQGPDLECIGLCKGDTVSDVIAKLATELCVIVEQFDLEGYDFSCLQISNSSQPDNLQELIQILIERICALEGIDPTTVDATSSDCPQNCIVSIAACFQYINATGDTVTTMDLLDYVTAIGNKICDNVTDIANLQTQVDALQTQINNTDADVANLQNTTATTASLNYQISSKTNPTSPTLYITSALREVENSLIQTKDALGTTTEMYQAIIKQGTVADEDKLFGNGIMSSISGWVSSPDALAESVGNAWLAIQDIREAVAYMQENCCNTGCASLSLNFTASLNVTLSGSFLTVYTSGSTGFTDGWKDCDASGTVITVKDTLGNTTNFRVDLVNLIDVPGGYTVDLDPTPVDVTTDLTITAESCFTNTQTEVTCEKDYVYTIYATATCPTVLITTYATAINYQFTATAGYTYTVSVYVKGGTTPTATQIISNPGLTVLNSITGLSSSTDYSLEVSVVSSANNTTVCPLQDFTTLPNDCTPPTNAIAQLTTP